MSYSRPVLVGLRVLRETVDESKKLSRAERTEFVNALYVAAAYVDLMLQIDSIPD